MSKPLFAMGWGVVVAVAALSCGKESSPGPANTAGAAGMGGGASAGKGGSGGGSAGAPVSGPAISSAPAEWQPPAECNGVGNLCPNLSGCTGDTLCQLLTDTCMTWDKANNRGWPKSAERPYCLNYSCMTYEEASCFCTGPAKANFPLCASGPAAVAGLCAGRGASCTTDKCCAGDVCLETQPGAGKCYGTCTTGADCESGCCTDQTDNGVLVCAPKAACDNPCKTRGQTCASGNECCRGTCVTGTDVADWAGCRATCTTNDDCDTGCCQLFADSTSGFCTDAKYCTCLPVDSACGMSAPYCCDGESCATFDNGASFSCKTACKLPADCSTGCCRLFAGEDNGVCGAADECP